MTHFDDLDYGLTDEIHVQADGPIRLVTLNRPHDLNGANRPMHQALAEVWDLLDADADARAVVLTGGGRAFSAGGDFEYMQENIDDEAMRAQTMAEGRAIIEGMIRCRLPVVAAVNGPAVGLGCSLALLADIVLIAQDAFLADPHLRMGLVPGDGGMSWPTLIGLSRAKEFLFLGTRIPADEAVRLGLASRSVPREQVLEEALTLARKLAAVPAVALQDTKRALNSYLEVQIEHAFTRGLDGELTSMGSDAHRDAVAAARTKAANR
jgi:enoyl-CoA hydratase